MGSPDDDPLRFPFGENWRRFLATVDERAIAEAEASLRQSLRVDSLAGRSFLDLGSGSGLFSLAAWRLGATVVSVDLDPQSVACTGELRKRFAAGVDRWSITRGSILDQSLLQSLGLFDVVYSWGVLHHTGAMWQALDNASRCTRIDGKLFVAIYNDQGRASRRWKRVKRWYNRLPTGWKWLVWGPCLIRLWGPTMVRDLCRFKPGATWNSYRGHRGMSAWHDVIDWVGGYPFEVARPEQVFQFLSDRGFRLLGLKTCGGGLGCNEFVLAREG
ncbi:MAG TPA: SAM-dependent methyltransferase [Planctomycetaceae bacterium]|nr:SAM-dependent methyltransferase [Planctomycetaceae bacterium]